MGDALRSEQGEVVLTGGPVEERGPVLALPVLEGLGQAAALALGQQHDAEDSKDGKGGKDHMVQEEATAVGDSGDGGSSLAHKAGPHDQTQPSTPVGRTCSEEVQG